MTTMNVRDSDNNIVAVEKPLTPGRTAAATSRPVVLSTEDLAVLSSIDTKLTTLAGYVDGLEALATSLNGYVDGIETLIGTTNTSLTSIAGYVDGLEALNTLLNGYVDGLETLVGSTNTKLDTLHTDIATTLAGYVDGLETLVTATNTRLSAGATAIAKAEDVASADADVGVPAMAVRRATPANTSGTDGDYEMLQMSGGRLWVDPSGVALTVTGMAAGATAISKAEDAASANADVGIPAMAVQKATPADTAGTDGDYEFLQMKNGRLWASVVLEAASALIGRAVADASAAAGGITDTARLASAAASTNALRVKASAGRIYQLSGKNNAAYDVFLVLYDATTSPPVPGTTAIRKKIVCPAGQAFVYDFPLGLYFATGIGYAFTKLVADADTTVLAAADITAFNMDYC